MSEFVEMTVPLEAAGMRIDAFLGESPEVGSRSHAGKLIAGGLVRLDGVPPKKRQLLVGGEQVRVELSEPAAHASAPAVSFSVIFEDDYLLIVDKPAGLVVHPAPGHRTGTLAQALAGLAAGGETGRAGIVHRLDKDTSGLLVVAKSDAVLRALQSALRRREIRREYLALVKGRPDAQSGTIDAPLGRDRRSPTQISIRQGTGRDAVTEFSVERELTGCSLLRVRLQTGRTHQIRVHLAAIGLPVLGDRQYGVPDRFGLTRQFLHAALLEFEHPVTSKSMRFESSLPADLAAALAVASAD